MATIPQEFAERILTGVTATDALEYRFKSLGAIFRERVKKEEAYNKKYEGAIEFASSFSEETWNGGFIMGLAISGLEMIPADTGIARRDYWRLAPKPKGNSDDWPTSYIIELDALNKTSD